MREAFSRSVRERCVWRVWGVTKGNEEDKGPGGTERRRAGLETTTKTLSFSRRTRAALTPRPLRPSHL